MTLSERAQRVVNSCGQILLPWTPDKFGGDVEVKHTRDGLYVQIGECA